MPSRLQLIAGKTSMRSVRPCARCLSLLGSFRCRATIARSSIWLGAMARRNIGAPTCRACFDRLYLPTDSREHEHLRTGTLMQRLREMAHSTSPQPHHQGRRNIRAKGKSEAHHLELARFASRVGSELRLSAITYQDLFRRMAQHRDPCDKGYIEYLRNRYFKDAP